MLTSGQVRLPRFVSALIVGALAARCGGGGSEPDHQAEWREVLRHKEAATVPGAAPEHKQVWADAVHAFVEKHPGHSRARDVWQLMQLEFADDLMDHGRAHQAIRFYRAVLAHDPRNERALHGWEQAAARLVISGQRLAEISRGMRQREVAARLGRPLPGWNHRVERRGTSFEAWYYQAGGGIAAVHFREGRVIATEETSSATVGRLSR